MFVFVNKAKPVYRALPHTPGKEVGVKTEKTAKVSHITEIQVYENLRCLKLYRTKRVVFLIRSYEAAKV